MSYDGYFKVYWSLFSSGQSGVLGPNAGWLLCALARHADKNGKCHPSNQLLAKETGMGISTVIKAKKQLRETGYITYKTVRNLGPNGEIRNIQYYTVKPLKPVVELPELKLSQDQDMNALLTSLDYMCREYPSIATYLSVHEDEMVKMKVPQRTLDWAEKTDVEANRVYLYYALSTVHTILKATRKLEIPANIYVMDQQGLERLGQLVKTFGGRSTTSGDPYEITVSKFIGWVVEKKKNKSLNLGILPLLAEEWVRD